MGVKHFGELHINNSCEYHNHDCRESVLDVVLFKKSVFEDFIFYFEHGFIFFASSTDWIDCVSPERTDIQQAEDQIYDCYCKWNYAKQVVFENEGKNKEANVTSNLDHRNEY